MNIFLAETKGHLFGLEVVYGIGNLTAGVDLLELNAVGVEPLAIRVLRGEALLDFAIVINLALLGIDQQHLTRLQTTLLGNHRRVEIHHTNLGGDHHRTGLGDGITGWAQTIAVEHATGVAAIAEE